MDAQTNDIASLAERLGAARISELQQDVPLRPGNITMIATNADDMWSALCARYTQSEAQYLFTKDAGFHAFVGHELMKTAPQDVLIHNFAKFVDTEAAFEYRMPYSQVVEMNSLSGGTLLVKRMIGISSTGWTAIIGSHSVGGQHRLYFSHVSNVGEIEKGLTLRWARHPKLTAFHSDDITCTSIYENIVAIWEEKKRALHIVELGNAASLAEPELYIVPPYKRTSIVQMSCTKKCAALIGDTNVCLILRFAKMEYVSMDELQLAPENDKKPAPINPMNGQPLEDLAGLGTPNGSGDKWESVQHPTYAAFDEHDENALAIGTDGGYVLSFDMGSDKIRQLRPQQMGLSAELFGLQDNYVHPGLEPISFVSSRGVMTCGTTACAMQHSFSVRCHDSPEMQLTRAPTRNSCMQQRDTNASVSVQVCGTAVFVHTANNNIFICSMVPSKFNRMLRYQVPCPLQNGETPFQLATASYRSLYVTLSYAFALMPDGRLIRIAPASEVQNAELLQKQASLAAQH